MLIDALELEDNAIVDADLCIMGAGAAGISIAREFHGTKLNVCLLEGGGFVYDEFSRKLYDGVSRGTYLVDWMHYVDGTRIRCFGGSTGHWVGWSRPLDDLDFEVRPWIAHSGWPFKSNRLKPYYKRAAPLLEVKPFGYDPASVVPGFAGHTFLDNSPEFSTDFFHLSPPTRFGDRYRKDIVSSSNIRLFLNANITNIDCTGEAKSATQLEVKTKKQTTFTVRAKYFVLALGGIENARMLLLSDKVQQNGLGNDHDLVGRFFTDHPHVNFGSVLFFDHDPALRFFDPFTPEGFNHHIFAVLRPAEELQYKHRLPNISMQLIKQQEPSAAAENAIRGHHALQHFLNKRSLNQPHSVYDVRIRSEAIPNPHSRVTLIPELDALGNRKVKLDWQLLAEDNLAIRDSAKLLAQELGRVSKGRVQMVLNDEVPWPNPWFGGHHIGTTRMHDDPKQGVVDKNCRLHSLENFYIAGSSVFPTPGCSNPTLTVVAMALRLADHLKEVMTV